MKYLEIENRTITGWSAPMYNWNAVEFADEIKQVCTKIKEGVYEYQDGTRFALTYDVDGDLISIGAFNICGNKNDYDDIYKL